MDADDRFFFWNTYAPDPDPVYERAMSRWSMFSRTEQLALTGTLRLTLLLYPQQVSNLTPDMRAALINLSVELESEVRS